MRSQITSPQGKKPASEGIGRGRGVGCWVSGVGCGVSGVGFRVSGVGCWVWGVGCGENLSLSR
ncbi:hypothetical protein [Coleofasciculus sp. E1-EBD-02]|uniref:hypothetical protein n=1 Tax=Coleofasciculus sp. E1-EBD-02 TaxID=3068481 RepID=UPI0032F3433D